MILLTYAVWDGTVHGMLFLAGLCRSHHLDIFSKFFKRLCLVPDFANVFFTKVLYIFSVVTHTTFKGIQLVQYSF